MRGSWERCGGSGAVGDCTGEEEDSRGCDGDGSGDCVVFGAVVSVVSCGVEGSCSRKERDVVRVNDCRSVIAAIVGAR